MNRNTMTMSSSGDYNKPAIKKVKLVFLGELSGTYMIIKINNIHYF